MQRLRDSGGFSDKVKDADNFYNDRIFSLRSEIDSFLFNHPLKEKIGAFEGAGYQSKGLYRPTVNSMMHRFDPNQRSFGKVNVKAIIEMIEHYTK